jgi:RNA polymerase sigma-70 factor (ECF subfamily)
LSLAQDRLVTAAIGGDAEAVRVLWQEHRRWVAAILLAHKPRDLDLDDLLQDVAMTFVRTISTLRDGSVLRPWLRTVAINAARASGREERRRKQGMRWTLGLTRKHEGRGRVAEAIDSETPENASSASEQSGRLIELAAQLPDGYREPLLLKAVQNMSYREIGRVMGLPESTIETRVARGRRMLRELARGAEDEQDGDGDGAGLESARAVRRGRVGGQEGM